MGDNAYEIPIQNQKYFGAGITRKKIVFVPSSQPRSTASENTAENICGQGRRIQDIYRSIVFDNASEPLPSSLAATRSSPGDALPTRTFDYTSANCLSVDISVAEEKEKEEKKSAYCTGEQQIELCGVCSLPLNSTMSQSSSVEAARDGKAKQAPHEASIVHQLCLPHSNLPLALDRSRKGLSMMQAHGWDPDARQGLGAAASGRLYPIKASMKKDTAGLGAKIREEPVKPKAQKLDAGKIRKREKEERRRTERLQEMFYGRDDIEKYLGPLEPG